MHDGNCFLSRAGEDREPGAFVVTGQGVRLVHKQLRRPLKYVRESHNPSEFLSKSSHPDKVSFGAPSREVIQPGGVPAICGFSTGVVSGECNAVAGRASAEARPASPKKTPASP